MDMEEYRGRITAYSVEELHRLVEEDPTAAIEWSEAEGAMADAFAKANGVAPDERTEEEVLKRVLSGLGMAGGPTPSPLRGYHESPRAS